MHKVLPSTTSYYKARTKYSPVLFRTPKQSLHKVLPSTTSYYKACTKYFPVLLRTTKLAQNTTQYYFVLQKLAQSTSQYYFVLQTKLAQTTSQYYFVLAKSTSQYYFVLQSLHQVLPSTTSYYKARKKYFPVLLRTSKLAKSTSRYFLLQSLHKVLPFSQYYFVLQSLHTYFPVLLRTTKLAPSTSQYYFVLQSLHKVLPSTTSYYKACTKYFPVLLRTTKLAQSTSQYNFVLQTKLAQSTSQYYFVLQSLRKLLPSTTSYYKACTNQSTSNSQFYPSFCLAIEFHFVRKGCAGSLKIGIFSSVLDDRTSLRAKTLRRTFENLQFYLSFGRSNLISCERVATEL